MADKYLYNNAGVITEREGLATSAGAGSAGKIPALDGAGRLSDTMMPVGVTPEVATIQASENIAAGDFVNVHNSGGARIRKADATTAGKEAHGFCLAAILSGASGSVYFEGSNTAVSGQTPGPVYLLTTAGTAGATAPSASGNAVQRLGVATSATSINFEPHPHVVLA